MTLSISPTRSGLTTTIVCQKCEHSGEDDPLTWIDVNGDVYFAGETPTGLREFLDRHADPDPMPDHQISAVVPHGTDYSGAFCGRCAQPIRPSDSDPWTWQHA